MSLRRASGDSLKAWAVRARARALEPQQSITAVLGKDVVLPCTYQAPEHGTVLQVTWLKRMDDGQGVELAVLHQEHGAYVQEPYTGRVLWQAQGSLNNGSILLKNAVQADEGVYECHLITFPLGSFESSLTLKVLVSLRKRLSVLSVASIPQSRTPEEPCFDFALTQIRPDQPDLVLDFGFIQEQLMRPVVEILDLRGCPENLGSCGQSSRPWRPACGFPLSHVRVFASAVPPLPTLNLGPPLEEGQGRTLAASCTAEGNPIPTVTWETAVPGTAKSQESSHQRSASITSEFYVVPGRSMHGKPLTCVVSHPGLQHQKRITHLLNVTYLSDASVLGHEAEEDWAEGREGAFLKCLGDGNPPPRYNWTRLDDPLPRGVKVKGDTLLFQRPLSPEDGGVYICHVANSFASKEARATVSITGSQAKQVDVVSVSMIGAGLISLVLLGLLVLVVVLMTCYHKRKTKRITEKYEEELTLTRENSIRRLHSSHSTDTRNQGFRLALSAPSSQQLGRHLQVCRSRGVGVRCPRCAGLQLPTEENLLLRSESRQGSLRADSLCRESLRGDSLCRDSRQGSFRADSLRETSLCSVLGEEVEGRSYSTLSTVREIETQTELPPLPPPTLVQECQTEKEKADEEEEEEEERDGENNIKQAMTHFVQENGTLRAKPTTNGIYINGRGHLV
ncbi:Nectin-4 [Varanus komodoensis]|nr:Nectin-4 [Varanus komodoensis]